MDVDSWKNQCFFAIQNYQLLVIHIHNSEIHSMFCCQY